MAKRKACACALGVKDSNKIYIRYCPKHAAVDALVAACKQAERNLSQGAMCPEDLTALRAALALAGGARKGG